MRKSIVGKLKVIDHHYESYDGYIGEENVLNWIEEVLAEQRRDERSGPGTSVTSYGRVRITVTPLGN
jgi:hypothetical protein